LAPSHSFVVSIVSHNLMTIEGMPLVAPLLGVCVGPRHLLVCGCHTSFFPLPSSIRDIPTDFSQSPFSSLEIPLRFPQRGVFAMRTPLLHFLASPLCLILPSRSLMPSPEMDVNFFSLLHPRVIYAFLLMGSNLLAIASMHCLLQIVPPSKLP